MFLHEDEDFKALIERVANDKNILPQLVEKDYWIMHCLWGLKGQGYDFELKGGTSLSKAFGVIERFSEDIDIKINPKKNETVYVGKNHDKSKHIESRKIFFDKLAVEVKIPFVKAFRDHNFDDEKYRSAGIVLAYDSEFDKTEDIKTGVLLEAGFAKTTPNVKKDISSWAYDFAIENIDKPKWIDNRSLDVKCFETGYTLIDKMEAVCRKHRQFLGSGKIEANFMRHYYDIYRLILNNDVQKFIKTDDYKKYKVECIGKKYSVDISKNEALMLKDKNTFNEFEKAYESKKTLYYGKFVPFVEIINKFRADAKEL